MIVYKQRPVHQSAKVLLSIVQKRVEERGDHRSKFTTLIDTVQQTPFRKPFLIRAKAYKLGPVRQSAKVQVGSKRGNHQSKKTTLFDTLHEPLLYNL